MPVRVARRYATGLVVAVLAAGCGSEAAPQVTASETGSPAWSSTVSTSDTSTPEGALVALAAAVNASDDAAIERLVCAKGRDDSTSIAQARAAMSEVDARLAGVRYVAEAGAVTDRTATSATGVLKVTVEGIPADLSAEAQQFLEASEAPRPINHRNGKEEINLIVENGAWVACGPSGVR